MEDVKVSGSGGNNDSSSVDEGSGWISGDWPLSSMEGSRSSNTIPKPFITFSKD
jgi:hypothetical protein